jgi:hypothetical protein
MIERHFRPYVFPEDEDVVYVGLDEWNRRPGNETPLLGTYLCNEAEVNQRFDEIEADLKRARRSTLAAVKKCQATIVRRRNGSTVANGKRTTKAKS